MGMFNWLFGSKTKHADKSADILLELASAINEAVQGDGNVGSRIEKVIRKEMRCNKCGNDFIVKDGISGTPGNLHLGCPVCGNAIASLTPY